MRATGIGSMPGAEFLQAANRALETSSELAFWPELPVRGPESALLGRGAGLMSELPMDLDAGDWRLTGSATTASERAARWWRSDLNALQEAADGYEGTLKVSVPGPLTMMAFVKQPRPTMNVVLLDSGARRDLVGALAEGIRVLVSDLQRSFPACPLIIQIDEPALSAVRAGQIKDFSGLHRLPPLGFDEALDALAQVAAATEPAASWLHSCGPDVDFGLIARAGFDGIAVDATLNRRLDDWGQWLDAGKTLGLGLVATQSAAVPRVDRVADAAERLAHDLNMDPELLDQQIVLTPACGLASWSEATAWQCLAALAEAGEQVSDRLLG